MKQKTLLTLLKQNIVFWVIIPNLVVAIFFSIWFSRDQVQRFYNKGNMMGNATHQFALEYFKEKIALLRSFSTTTDRNKKTNLASELPTLFVQHPHFKKLVWLSPEKLIKATYPTGTTEIEFPLLLKEMLPNQLILSQTLISSESAELITYIGFELPNREVIVGELNLHFLNTQIRAFLPHNNHVMITDKYGNIIVDSDQRLSEQSTSLQQGSVVKVHQVVSEVEGFYIANGIFYFGETIHLPDTDWRIIVSQPVSNIFYPIIITVLILICLLLIASYLMMIRFPNAIAQDLVLPLNRFTTTISEAAEGNISKPSSNDNAFVELTIIETEFEKMAQTILSREQKYKSLFENVPEGIYHTTIDGQFLNVNHTLVRLLGFHDQEELLRAYNNIENDVYVNMEIRDRLIRKIKQQKKIEGFETKLRNRIGEEIEVSLNMNGVFDTNNQLIYLEGSVTDITVRKQAELDLLKQQEDLKAMVQKKTDKLFDIVEELKKRNREMDLFTHMSDMLQACKSEAESFEIVSSICLKMFPRASGFIGILTKSTQFIEIIADFGRQTWKERLMDQKDCWALRKGDKHVILDTKNEPTCAHFHGEVTSSICMPIVADYKLIGVIHLCQDIREKTTTTRMKTISNISDQLKRITEFYGLCLSNIRLKEKLHHQSIVDPLTGLFNRRHMSLILKREFDRAIRNQTSVGLILMDVDHFKKFNKTFGHDAGDKVLSTLGASLREQTRSEDIACRYGGEELILILPDCTPQNTYQKAEEIRTLIEALEIENYRDQLKVTVSIGIASFPINGSIMEDVIKAAETALYTAKAMGRNKVIPKPSKL